MKIILLITAMTFTSLASMASSSENSDRLTEMFFPGYAHEFAQLINMEQLKKDVAYSLSGVAVADQCVALMNKTMATGEVGKYIAQTYQDNANRLPLLSRGSAMGKYCRLYPKMTEKEKSMVWVLVLTAMAHFESSCNATIAAKGPNGTAYGYYQLHRYHEHEYDGQRGFCKKGDAGKPKEASRCTLGMLERQFDYNNGELFSNQSYWEVLRPKGPAKKAGIIRRALERSSLCNPVAI